MNIAQAFEQLRQSLATVYEQREAENVARWVFEDVLGVRNFRRNDQVPSHQLGELARIQSRLLNGEPVQYVLGEADFYGLKFKVDPRVLIPRPETEELVHWVLETLKEEGLGQEGSLLDIGTGSGCISISLKKKAPALVVSTVDISGEALEIARENARRHEVSVRFFQADILKPEEWPELGGSYQLIVSNPPYITPQEKVLMSKGVLDFEPGLALFTPPDDPLLYYRAIAGFTDNYLPPGGFLFFEVSEFFGEELRRYLQHQGFADVELRRDLSGKDRMIRAKK